MERTTYKTKQKQLITDFFAENVHKQFSAKEAFCQISAQEDIGESTVYRLLKQLTEEGIIRRFQGKNAKAVVYQFAGQTSHCHEHFHLKCADCGKLIHLDCQQVSGFEAHVARHHGFSIDYMKTVLYGTCADCNEKEHHHET